MIWEYLVENLRHSDYDEDYRGGMGREIAASLDDSRTRAQLEERGREGWELVTVASGVGFFKRKSSAAKKARA